ncbi:unnamed protein product [Symbiodinium sp. CCMP2456]|nr:unnamed protein product [Symbiodinium sp. CCMP2456]
MAEAAEARGTRWKYFVNSERQSLKGRFILDLSRFGSPVRLDVTAFANKVRSDKWLLLAACLLIDFIGMASYLVLLLGEVTDIMWAPFAGFLLQYLFGSWLVSSLGALEEFLPFTDILPTATLAWAICHVECLRFLRAAACLQHFAHKVECPQVLKQVTKMRTTKSRNHAEVLKRFRLTRFGWERRRAHLRDGKKRRRSPQQKRNTNKIDFVHRHDMLKMVRTASYFKLRIRDFPKDPNPNIKSTRAIVGSHFG